MIPAATVRRLVAAARAARRRAYAPYSRFRVGAAVLAGGRIHAGCNVENASYGLTVCAERSAVAAMAAAGGRRLRAVAVASGTSPPTPPCGMCLQTLAEFAGPGLTVLLAGPRGAPVATTLGALLPRAFGPGDLPGSSARRGGGRARPDHAARDRRPGTGGPGPAAG